jgi:thiol-disulfide isomerase/thioredoxin
MKHFKHAALLALLCTYASTFAFSKNEAILTGKIEGLENNAKVRLSSMRNYADTVTITNGEFKFVIPADKMWDTYFIIWDNNGTQVTYNVLLKEGSRLHFLLDKMTEKFTLSGDSNAKEQNDYWQGLYAASAPYWAIRRLQAQTTNAARIDELNKRLKDAESKSDIYSKNWVKKHKSSPYSLSVINFSIYKGLRNGRDTVTEKYYDYLLPEAKTNNYIAVSLEGQLSIFTDKYSKKGEQATGFTIKDISGKTIKLTDFRKQYVLIDFWASWCGPCRANNPMLAKLHSKYKNSGLKVLSISVDTDAKKWKAAVLKDKMTWLQGSDLMGQTNGVGLDYGITAVPQYVLIDPEGKIVLKSIGGDIPLVEKTLTGIFNK